MRSTTLSNLDALEEQFRTLLRNYGEFDPSSPVNPVDAFFAYRLLLHRNPDRGSELPALLSHTGTFRAFLAELLSAPEFSHCSGYLPPNRLLMSEAPGFRFWFNTNDREMGVLMGLGMYEPESSALVRQLVEPGMHCIDIGAQTGYFSCMLATLVGPYGRVYAFEPMPSSYALLEKNIMENQFTDRVESYPYAASDIATLLHASFVSNMYVAGEVNGGERVTMASKRIDDVVEGTIDFIKIDIEGHEPSALRGMQRLIAEHHPLILSEVNEYWRRHCSQTSGVAYIAFLNSLGYEVFAVNDINSPIHRSSRRLDNLDVMNIIAIPCGRAESVRAKLRGTSW